MDYLNSKQRFGWGSMLIFFGLSQAVNLFPAVPELVKAAIIAFGGLVGLGIFFSARNEKMLLIPAYLQLAIAAIAFLAILNLVSGEMLAAIILFLAAFPFFVVYFFKREHWWALIPGYALLALSVMLLLLGGGLIDGGFVATYVLGAIAFPFLVVYFKDKNSWWALIPAYVMLVLGVMIGLIDANWLRGLIVPAYIMLAISFPFFYVYFKNRSHWWALIPAGVTALIGLGFALGAGLVKYVIPSVLVLAGVWLLVNNLRQE